jgi:hypothetical protein
VDGMVRAWVRLHGMGRPATGSELREAARAALSTEPGAEAGAAGPPEPEQEPAPARRDPLMEID